ncbi:N-acetylglucosamine-6-phosphate deacetylase [Pseudogemmobacter humi]|uniref:N-acetylglucosamine-6-phosphate deacetylase n=1 Tax=Pseudogemmobacter humi TaxID=2483812 RepID=A0A3P5WNZ5_9RHOB|nr:N-acetylglucosamine-6-phosphate deacetylase [Pseudogemmobacter humi]VDC20286.1 N-acetylglucosamine-6-phosphate deacetylase [Pseudogemmobacter humi]
MTIRFSGATVFDGQKFLDDPVLHPAGQPAEPQHIELDGGWILPGLVDLQVNGGDGIMIGGQTSAADLARICATHARLGAVSILPTLITDSPAATRAVLKAGAEATRAAVPGFLGLHLEGPHLDPRRKGAHDPALIRPMSDADLNLICEARSDLPALMVTLAPEAADARQIATLAAAGVLVSLGHSDCGYDAAAAAFAAGASGVTHLFNAMSQLTTREPGLVGAALDLAPAIGLIADGFHVHPAAIRIAMAAAGGRIHLVSDAMAPAGTRLDAFDLNGRRILRRDGRLTLEDGTLAGADLTLPQAIATMIGAGVAPEIAFAMATSRPARAIGRDDIGHLRAGARADFIHLGPDLSLRAVWQAGRRIL